MAEANEVKFYRLDGNNGATFFLPLTSWREWRRGAEFYRALSWLGRVKKTALKLSYFVARNRSSLTAKELEGIMVQTLRLDFEASVGRNDSVMISPTRDKIIIHRHGRGYEKFIAGESLAGGRQEVAVYRHLAKVKPDNFCCSPVDVLHETPGVLHFFMAYAAKKFREDIPDLMSLLPSLSEFWKSSASVRPWSQMWAQISPDFPVSAGEKEGETPVGLVHRDFKPWNVKSGAKPLFFDFESADFAGAPLEDFFNYVVDPLMSRLSAEALWRQLLKRRLLLQAAEYLSALGIDPDQVPRYWKWYLGERFTFWAHQKQDGKSRKFQELYEISRP